MRVDPVQKLKETDEAIATLEKLGMEVPIEAYEIQALCRMAVAAIPETIQPSERRTMELSVNDPTMVKIHIESCITALRDEDGRTKTRQLALAVTKLEEAVFWIDDHQRRN
jgi:hypothetical protein